MISIIFWNCPMKSSCRFNLTVLLNVIISVFVTSASEIVVKSDVFVSGQEGYNTYRIPSIILTPKGTLLAFCEGRKDNSRDHGDVDLVMKKSYDNGSTWSEMQIVYEEGDTAKITVGNPCPVIDQTDSTIFLFFCRDNIDVFYTKSMDDGITWSTPTEVTHQVGKPDWIWYATGPGIGIQIQQQRYKNRLIIPCDHRNNKEGKSDSIKYGNGSHVIYSDDHGKTWNLSTVVQPGANECQVVELQNDSLLLNARMQTNRKGYRGISKSGDGGATWSALKHDQNLSDPRCQASLIRFRMNGEKKKSFLLFSNPVPPEPVSEKRGKRLNLTVRLSYDEGNTWPVHRILQDGPAAYSCLVQLPDGLIGCLYENGKKRTHEHITFAKFSLQWLLDTSDR